MNADAEILITPRGFDAAPYFEQWFGLWAMHEPDFLALVNVVERLDIAAHLRSDAPIEAKAAADKAFDSRDGVAILSLAGTLQKQSSSLSRNTSTVVARRQLRAAVQDDNIRSILLAIESPGGTVAGTKELADDVAAAATKKPVYAFIEDLGASAAYWIASQATKVFANPSGLVGSIGTYGVVYDASAAAAQKGIKVHVVRAGAFKGAGVPGTEVTAEQLADYQRIVDQQNSFFLAGVAAGRKMPAARVQELADGRVHIAAQARDLALIDGVQSLDETFQQLLQAAVPSQKGTRKMSEPEKPLTATHAEIVSACRGCKPSEGADALFVCDQLAKGATVAQARDAWQDTLQARIDARDAELKEAKSAAPAPKPAGNKPLNDNPNPKAETPADPIAAFDEAVAAKMKGGMSKPRAISAVVHENPELHANYLAAFNERTRKR